MPHIQAELKEAESTETHMFKFKLNWTMQKLVKRAVLYYVRNDPEKKLEAILNPKQGDSNE
jgi:hypothetical protein